MYPKTTREARTITPRHAIPIELRCLTRVAAVEVSGREPSRGLGELAAKMFARAEESYCTLRETRNERGFAQQGRDRQS